jgi:two-component system, sensor histidine kinase and response regulator
MMRNQAPESNAPPATAAAVVLVIDDQAANLRLIEALLGEAGYVTVAALGGAAGLAAAQASPPDLVLLDMCMPGMDGFDVLRALRAFPSTADVPIIFLTVDGDRENLIRAFAAGVNDYVVKPFVSRELLARVRTHVDLKKSRDALRRFAVEKQEMAELVAHDLRNYFATIVMASELQCRIPDADARVVMLARNIRTSADAGLLFLHALLDQQEDQNSGARFEPLPARQLLCDAMDLLSASAESKAITLELEPNEPMVVTGFRSGAVHVLQNLLSNAIKYSPPQSRVSVATSSNGKRGRMMVMDRGPGVSESDRERLFQRFTRLSAETTAGEGKTGLGLALARQRARTMGGDVWYQDRGGGGSIFTLELPLA